ncbi:LysR family transcriptional regulator (plasmid) [Actinomadura sp. ATCC 31491]|uniref:LysR family transcriptional regulator n=1 Tax=Actinomadura luzonensis TaxID=2805427 RepID=A0ABT0GBL5_9ACTN|nr:LysR family transcriptional regulator [Actinomadura luzonensis]MCK2221994.1 LysR family transcriptional regulator [Actinomadura luzonensis]
MELRDIEIFLTLAEELHFGRTAERLRVTPSRITKAIQRQERLIGTLLFERTNRTVRLTPYGQQLHRELSAGYRQIINGIESVSAAVRGVSGTLTIGSMGGAGTWMIKNVVELVQTRHPAVRILHRDIDAVDPLALLRSGDIDIGHLWLPLREPNLTLGPVTHTSRQVLMIAATHPFAAGDAVCREDFGDLTFVSHTSPVPPYLEEVFQPFHTPAGRSIPRGPAVSSWEDILKVVSAGQGVIATVEEVARFYPWPDLAYVPVRDAPGVKWAFAWRTAAENDLIRHFAQIARELAGGVAS